jgi:hypothetical protein
MRWLLPFLLLAPSAHAASEKREAKREARTVKRETRNVTEAAEMFWRSLRWQDLSAAAAFLEHPDNRITWTTSMATAEQYRSASVLTVQVGPELDEGDGIEREAVVVVRTEAIGSDQVLRTTVLTQDWYKTEAGWFIEPGQEQGVVADP